MALACTRHNNDKDKIKTDYKLDYDSANYVLNVPGNGLRPHYINDPHIRLQKFGGNISANITDVNSSLLGLDRPTRGRDCTKQLYNNDKYFKNSFPEMSDEITHQTRAENPAWELRDLEQNRWNYLLVNPQTHTEAPFDNNVSSRILEKDNYARG